MIDIFIYSLYLKSEEVMAASHLHLGIVSYNQDFLGDQSSCSEGCSQNSKRK